MLKIATWNVNSLRMRLTQIIDWLNHNQPAVLALQETKLEDDKFPEQLFQDMGYQVVFCGQQKYNGVAILSREPTYAILKQLPGSDDPQKRFIAAVYPYDNHRFRIINLYVPNGENIASEKYGYKLSWLEKLEVFLREEIRQYEKMVILGDFNIAPEPKDVYDPKKWEGRVLFSEPERAHFKKLLSIGFHDAFRLKQPGDNEFSWWDYRTFAFGRNQGLRIDHILITEPLVNDLQHCYIDKNLRGVEKPSDHAPVVATFY